MKKILVVGIGPGEKDYLLPIAKRKVEEAQVLVGGKRALELLATDGQETREIKGNLQDIVDYIKAQSQEKQVAVLLSGDPGLYGMLNFLLKHFLPEELEIIPGISSMQMCFARLKLPWQDIKIVSLHGRSKDQLLNWVRNYPKIAFFTDSQFPPQEVGAFLLQNGVENKRVIVGESLSYPEERIVETDLEGIQNFSGFKNCVMLVLKKDESQPSSYWSYATPGIPDSFFVRGKVPMTKEEVRAVTIAKSRLHKDSVVYDIGAGTGSISVECALLAGRVVAIEKNPEGINLIEENKKLFGLENLTIKAGDAAHLLAELPPAHRIIIGGSGGQLKRIMELTKEKLLPQGRVIINCIALETLFESLTLLEDLGFREVEVSQVSVARGEKVGRLHMLKGLNPIYILAAEKGAE